MKKGYSINQTNRKIKTKKGNSNLKINKKKMIKDRRSMTKTDKEGRSNKKTNRK